MGRDISLRKTCKWPAGLGKEDGITIHQGNVNEKYNERSPHSWAILKKEEKNNNKTAKVDRDVEKLRCTFPGFGKYQAG